VTARVATASWADLRTGRAAGVIGIVLGILAGWVALPPISTRNLVLPVVIGVAGIAAGAWATTRGEKRVGIGAIVASVAGIVVAIFATRASVGNLELVMSWGALTAASLVYATPLTFAAIGGMFSERSGVVNIGLEGMMLIGAFFGAWGADTTDSWIGGLLIALVAGAALALVHAFFAIHLRADQIVSGTAVNFLALGITGYLYINIYGDRGTPPDLPQIPDVNLSRLQDVFFFGDAFGSLNLMIWLSIATVALSYIAMFKTPAGLRIRSVGEHPKAADTVGIPVYRTRYVAVVVSGMLAALGGTFLSIGFNHSFTENMTAGRGFIALAALIFGGWRPVGAFAAALLFGFSSALAQRLGLVESWQSYQLLFQTLPYVLTLIAVAGVIGRSIPPAAVGRPYVK